MKLYNSVGPNPRVVRMFAAEKGLDIPRVEVNLRGGENRQAEFRTKNPAGQTPALELDDGRFVSEITAICEYLDEMRTPSLIGATAEERAETRMWVRRLDLNILEPMANGYRYSEGLKIFANRIHCIPQAADDLKASARKWLIWLDADMAGRTMVCGDRFTLADIMLFCFADFFARVGQPLDESLTHLHDWRARIAARPNAAA